MSNAKYDSPDKDAGQCAEIKSARASLLDRVAAQRDRANTEVQRAMRLSELAYLLEKHPDVARIFELMDDVRL
jgi:hypothetical protein